MSDPALYSASSAASDPRAAQAAALTASGVSWSAILAGAAAAAALSFILVILGVGLGLSSVSPWSGEGLSAKSITFATAGWLVFTQLASAGIGGYLAGRLRVKWAGVHTQEVYFRDTAHGFLAWCAASLLTAALLGSAVGSVISGGTRLAGAGMGAAGAMVAAGASANAGADKPGQGGMGEAASGYFIDMLLRQPGTSPAATPATPAAPASPAAEAPLALPETPGNPAAPAPRAIDGTAMPPAQRMEITRILVHAWQQGTLPDPDRAYAGRLVARSTGLSQADAEKRVTDIFNNGKKVIDDATARAKDNADAARKAAAYGSLWMFFSLLLGAFVASLAATYGGRRRDLPSFVAPRNVPTEPVIDN